MFDKEKFIKNNNEFLYSKLLDFLDCEVKLRNMDRVLVILSNGPQSTIRYEGNQYAMYRSAYSKEILIVDEISVEHGVSFKQAMFTLHAEELIELIRAKYRCPK